MIIKTFVLVGTILSYDPVFVTVEFNLNPATNSGPAIAVLPKTAIPCDISVGNVIYVLKNENEDHTHITCSED